MSALDDQVAAESLPVWQPLKRAEGPANADTLQRALGFDFDVWRNDLYEVVAMADPSGGVHLLVNRHDRAAVRDWRHFQQIKNEVVGEEAEAIELYPAESRLLDISNVYHLWAIPPGEVYDFGFPQGKVLSHEQAEEGWQEPFQPGLTVGQRLDPSRRHA